MPTWQEFSSIILLQTNIDIECFHIYVKKEQYNYCMNIMSINKIYFKIVSLLIVTGNLENLANKTRTSNSKIYYCLN